MTATDTTEIVLDRPAPNPLTLIQSAIERGMSVADLTGLFDLQERYERQQAAQKFADAITAFQAECPQIEKKRAGPTARGGDRPAYHFAPYEEIDRTARPHMNRNGIVATFTTAINERGWTKVTCRIRVGTHFEETDFEMPPAGGNSMTSGPQVAGITLSYGKRYALCAALNIVTKEEDPDGSHEGVANAITPAQVKEINGLVAKCSEAGSPVAMDRFAAWIGIQRLEDMNQADFPKTIAELRRKLAQAQKAKAGAT